jgi:hypothetical protein
MTRNELFWCHCAACRRFARDKDGDGYGIGRCQAHEWAQKELSPKEAEQFFKNELGDKVFYAGNNGRDDRFCSQFLAKASPAIQK